MRSFSELVVVKAAFCVCLLLTRSVEGRNSDKIKAALEALDAIGYSESAGVMSIDGVLDRLRPPEITLAAKARVLAGLPAEGEVMPSDAERRKLAALDSILEYHRRNSVYAIKVIDVPQACLAFHARAVLLISENALHLLSVEELQAVAAHEIGHEYIWDEYQRAFDARNSRKLRELETRCDAIALVTLLRLELNPESLISGISKLTRFNERIGATANAGDYFPLKERIHAMRAIIEILNR
ncbi:MAG TPA: hypothetical protein VGQ81_02460 [Acidobacteriota bacterium]|nr:hypothetical protein [Acidobacteriota bacterium]